MNDYLFIYGTLLWPANALREEVQRCGSFIGSGTVQGSIYNLGEFPGYKTEGSGLVYGEVWQIDNGEIWKTLDRFEVAPNLYERIKVPCQLEKLHLPAVNIYQYCGEISKSIRIPHGDYMRFLRESASSDGDAV